MSRSYYVIELSARWLTVLLVALALLMVLSFALGYGAASSVGDGGAVAAAAPTPVVVADEVIEPTPTPGSPQPTAPAATPTRRPAPPTAVPPTPKPPTPKPTVQPRPTEQPESEFWVQVVASSKEESIDDARSKLDGLGFGRDNQKVVRSNVVGGNELIKLRVGPFPDRTSADRVLQRMRAAGFPDAWVVVP